MGKKQKDVGHTVFRRECSLTCFKRQREKYWRQIWKWGNFISIEEDIFKEHIAPALSANIKLGYRLSANTSVFWQPGIATQTQSITTKTYNVSQRYRFIYTNIGINIRP